MDRGKKTSTPSNRQMARANPCPPPVSYDGAWGTGGGAVKSISCSQA